MPKQNNYAVITGASGGIGFALASECAKAGFSLFLVSRDDAALHEAAKKLRSTYGVKCYTLTIDLTDPAAAKKIHVSAKRYGTPTHLINNAGFGDYGPYAESDWQRQADMIGVNVTALSHLTRLFLPDMVAAGYGRILNMGSVASFVPGPLMSVYFATKHYVLAFSESLAEELRGSGVAVTAYCPGPTATKFEDAAHLKPSKLYKGGLLKPQKVGAHGFAAMQKGRRVVVYGPKNRLYIALSTFVPRSIKARFMARSNALKN